MAYILEKIGNTYNLPKKYFTCDAKSDLDGISLVDVPIGSEAYCILEEENYILDSNKQWHKKKIGEDLTGQAQPDWNQNDSTAADYVKNRTHYEKSSYTDYVLNMSGNEITGLSMPKVGETITVKINGVESVETVKTGRSGTLGNYTYIGTIDFDSLRKGRTGWCVVAVSEGTFGFANPDTTMSAFSTVVHKIDDKFINFDGFVRTFDYHFKGESHYKVLYNSAGDECLLYTCSDFILPEKNSQLFGFMDEIGFSIIGSTRVTSCFVKGFKISDLDGSITVENVVLGTNTAEMEQLAAGYGYTLTTKPNA